MPLFNFKKKSLKRKYSSSSDIITEKAIYKSRPLYQDMPLKQHSGVTKAADDYKSEAVISEANISEAIIIEDTQSEAGKANRNIDISEATTSGADNIDTVEIKKCDEVNAVSDEGDIDYDKVEVKLHPLLERFLDAESYEEKLNIFYLMKNENNEKLLSDVAMSLDIHLSKETVEEQYQEILYCLRTMEKFECNRMRR